MVLYFMCVQDSLYGELLLCGERDSSPFCIIHKFHDMAVANEYDCPLLTLSHDLRIIHSITQLQLHYLFVMNIHTHVCLSTIMDPT